jgi:arylsulfatase A-like enzyme
MFTGRWPHELSAGWLTPLDGQYPTLAAWLGGRGYATTGFVANTAYCGADSGLARGFTFYQDHIFPELTVLETAELVNRALEGIRAITFFAEDWLASTGLLAHVERFLRSLDDSRKAAAEVNRELLHWLVQRPRPERPFFAFLNYYDAHFPYELPSGGLHRFGAEPSDSHERWLIHQWGLLDMKAVSAQGVAFAAAAYDDCIAELDERIGMLIDELDRRGVLNQTWLIVTSDHGESFDEHPGYFVHGTSLYDTELHVPLVMVPPGGIATKRVVKQPVSLRDLAATVVDLAGQSTGSPFPGVSLAGLWSQPSPAAPMQPFAVSRSLAELVPNNPKLRDQWDRPTLLPAVGAVKDDEWSYIRREGQVREELFHVSQDPGEQHNLATDLAAQTVLQKMRAALNELTGGPLVTERFSR